MITVWWSARQLSRLSDSADCFPPMFALGSDNAVYALFSGAEPFFLFFFCPQKCISSVATNSVPASTDDRDCLFWNFNRVPYLKMAPMINGFPSHLPTGTVWVFWQSDSPSSPSLLFLGEHLCFDFIWRKARKVVVHHHLRSDAFETVRSG